MIRIIFPLIGIFVFSLWELRTSKPEDHVFQSYKDSQAAHFAAVQAILTRNSGDNEKRVIRDQQLATIAGLRFDKKLADESSFILKSIEVLALGYKEALPILVSFKKFPLNSDFEGPLFIESFNLVPKTEWRNCERDSDCVYSQKFCPIYLAVNKGFETEFFGYAQAKIRAHEAGFSVYSAAEEKIAPYCGQKSLMTLHAICAGKCAASQFWR